MPLTMTMSQYYRHAQAQARAQATKKEQAAVADRTRQRGVGSSTNSIIQQLQAAQNAANQANLARFNKAEGLLASQGEAGRARIGRNTEQAQAQATQGLTSRGLGNTTLTSAVSRGIADDAELQRQQLEEGVSRQQAGLLERRNDIGPDMGMYGSLLQSLAQNQAATQSQAPKRQVISMGWSPALRAAMAR